MQAKGCFEMQIFRAPCILKDCGRNKMLCYHTRCKMDFVLCGEPTKKKNGNNESLQ